MKFNTSGKFQGTGLGTYGAKLIADLLGYPSHLKPATKPARRSSLRFPLRTSVSSLKEKNAASFIVNHISGRVKPSMIRVQSIERSKIEGTLLANAIIDLDARNMGYVFTELGQEFPRERRQLSFKHPGTIIIARDDQGQLIGYLEFGPGWDDPKECYISSIQIVPHHRNGSVLLALLRHAMRTIEAGRGSTVRTHVQENNQTAIRLLERVGFSMDRPSARKGTIPATMTLPLKWPHKRSQQGSAHDSPGHQ